MISSLRKSHAASTRTTATPAAYNDSFSMESYITEQWNEIAMASWKEMRREMADTAPPTGLVVYVLDVSASMAKIKENLAKSVAAVMKVMKCVCPGVAQTVVTYTDFDDDSLMRPPVVEAPFSLDWSPETITNYLNEDVVVRGGGLTGREAFDVALNFVLRELVPSFRHIGNCDASTPVLIFNLTDEDMRLCDNKGVYGRVNTPVYGECDYTCSECDHTEATRSATFFKQRWGMNRPTTAKELKDLLIEKNCWLRCLSYGDNLPPGYTELCKVDGDYGADNDRWQFFLSDENYYHCTYEPVLRMLAKQQWCLFSNVSSTFSATAVLKNVPPHLIEKFVALGEVVEVDPAWNITQAQVEDFKSRIEVPHVCKVSKLVHGGELSSDNFLLSNAYDRVSTLSAYQNRQQECAAELADRFGSGGNVASSLVSLFNTAAENMSEDDIGKTEFGHCLCKGCTKLYGGVKDKLINKDRYIAVQLARYLAKSLFEPMIKDEVMVCVGAALNHVIGAFYNCVATQSSHCFEIQKILSDLKGNRNDGTSSDSRKRAYDIIRNSRAERNVHYDAATAISKMIEKKKETIIKKKKKEDITDDDGDRIVWLYLKNFAYVEREVRNLTKNLTPEQFKRFEMPECYSVVKTIAANIEATVDIADIPESASASSRFVAIPVTELYTLESMNQIISERATKYFDGDTIVAAMTFIPASDALQMLTNLVDTKYGLETKGYSGVKAVAAAVSSESTTDFFAKVGFEALKSFVPAKRRPEGLSTETMFEVVMGDGFEGSLADKLSNKITLSHIAGWAKKYNGTNVLRKKIEHFLVVWSLVKMQKNGICDGYRAFDVKELVFEKESYFTCTTCNMPVLKEERFGVTDMCIRCVKPKDANEFIRSNFGGDGKEKDFAAPEQEGVQPPPSSTTTSGGDGEEEDFAALKQEGPLKFSNWKLITDKNDADEKIEGKETVTEYKILVERLKSKNKQEKVEAANKIIRTRLNPGVYFTNITTALSAAKACSLMGEGGRKLVHVMLENGVCSIPSAVCLECAVCKSIYKASPLAPAKKQYRLCPWCRTARKFKLAGKPGLELLQKMIVNKKDTVSDNQFLWALEHEVSKLSRGVSSDATEDIENFFKTMREKTPDDNTTMFKEVLKTEISVAKYGRVKIMSEVYDGGPCLLQDKVEWSKFNTEVCEKGLLGYRLDKQWSGWQDMCAAKLDDTWKFVHQTAVKEGARDDLMKTLGVTDFINVKAIGDKIRSIVNRQKSV
uniref:Wsv465-like protein n=1 Tax=Sesarmops intermedium nimavirus TaxID=2133796 RepID=A0A401IPP0_9VIRU|nr:wsv465-like protein [Sesarmops intermedium nimavirus]